MTNPDETVRLGRSSLIVARLGLGAAPLGNVMGPVSDDEATRIVTAAARTTSVIVDTAPFYGEGLSETRVGTALATLDASAVVLSTKVGRLVRDGAIVEDYSYDGVMRSLEDSSVRLKGAAVGIVHIHDPDAHFDAAATGMFRALEELRRAGTIKAISAGMNQWQMLSRLLDHADFDCFLLAGRYTLLDRSAEAEFLPKCQARGAGLILGGVLNSGILADPRPGATYNYVPAPEALLARALNLKSICAAHGVPLKAAALQFPFRHPAVTTVIVGVRSVAEWDENRDLLQMPIPAALWNALGS